MKRILFNFRLGGLLVAAALFMLALAAPSYAQMTRGALSGTIRDAAGATVPGAQVKVSNPQTNVNREATTSDEGFYRLGGLEPGTYVVMVEKTGFSKVENHAVTISQSNETTFDAELKAGSVSGTVDVTAQTEAITVNKSNGTVGLTVTAKQAVDLPLGAARNINNLALLSPNVFNTGGQTGISANGQRSRNNNFTIDGSDNNDVSVTLATTPVVPEAVGEFQIQTNPYSVEFGRNTGAQINVITRGGGNSFHGEAWEYYRGSRLNALDNIEKATLTRPSRFNRNQFGFDINGPLHLPRFGEGGRSIYDGRNRTFFFYLFQGDRTRTGASRGPTTRIPTQAGFAALSTVPLGAGQTPGSRTAVLDRLGFLNSVYANGAPCRTGSISNLTVNGVPIQTCQVNVGISQPNDTYNHTLRIDHKLTANDNLTGRYISNKPTDSNVISNTNFGSIFAGEQAIFDQNLALSETHVFNDKVLNEFRFSYIRRNLQFPEHDKVSPTANIGGLFTIGGASNFPQGRVQNSYQFSDTLSMLRGNHSIKFGTDIRRIQLFNLAAFDSKGTFGFNNLQDYMNNLAATFQQALQTATFNAKQVQQFYFAQDDWRVTPNLTLNLGVRYENSSVPFGFFGATDAQSLAALVPGPVKRDNNNWAPAVGFAYSPHSKDGVMNTIFGDGLSSIRGGYRIAYDLIFYNILTVNASNYPRVVVPVVQNVQNLYPNLLPLTGTAAFNPLAGYVNSPVDTVNPYSQLWSLSWQREVHHNYVFEIGYTGSHSLKQINQMQANPALLTAAQIATVQSTRSATSIPAAQARRLFPQFGSRTLITTLSSAIYHAGYATVNRRFSRHLQFGASYTFGKLISDNDESLALASIATPSPQVPQSYFNLRADRSISAFNRKQRFVANFIYEVPAPGFAKDSSVGKQVFGGWQISGIITRQAGTPFTIVTGVDSNGNGTATGDRPNLNPAGTLTLDPVTGNLRTFTSPLVGGRFFVPLGTNGLPLQNSLGDGNLGKNTYTSPGFRNTDLSVQKKFTFMETRQVIFRADFLNAFNQDNYGRPINNMNNPDFGKNLNNWGNRSITLSMKIKL
ncbi:MAG: TonB-dependent receptor [Acidobacteriota bacterium]|nr:TonB-dependent receptor [Acidobacteriota bacterium]